MSYTIVPLNLARDRDALVGLWCENFEDPRDKELTARAFCWLYEPDPVTQVQTWVAFDHGSPSAIGCATAFRVDRYVDGELVGGAIATAMAVTQMHRTLAAALGLQKAIVAGSRETGVSLLIGSPTHRALPMCARAGYVAIGESHKWTMRLATQSPAVDAGRTSSDIQLVDRADARFDRLMDAARRSHRVVANKRSMFLNWHNAQLSLVGYQYFCLVSAEGHDVLGYVGFYRNDGGVFVTDILTDTRETPIVESLLERFVRWAQAQGLAWIGLRFFGASQFEDTLLRLGFSRKAGSSAPVVVRVAPGVSNDAKATLLDRQQWFGCGVEIGA